MNTKSIFAKVFIACFLSLCGICASAKKFISLEEISKDEFEEASKGSDKYTSPLFSDTIIANELTTQIIQDARKRYEDLIKVDEYDYDMPLPSDTAYEDWFSIKSLVKFDKLNLYGFYISRIHDAVLLCYNSETGRFIGEMLYPFTISPQGILISQVGYDCDWELNLEFYEPITSENQRVHSFAKLFDRSICSEFLCFYPDPMIKEYYPDYSVFWGSENELYMSLPYYYDKLYQLHFYRITIHHP